MAMFPCDRHGHRVPGPNHGVYVAYGAGADLTRHYLRLCDMHSLQVERGLDEFEVDPESGAVRSNGRTWACLTCSKPIDETGWQVFITHYVSKNDRKDYWAQLHRGCVLPPLLAPPARIDLTA